jgi:hypothetical protein
MDLRPRSLAGRLSVEDEPEGLGGRGKAAGVGAAAAAAIGKSGEEVGMEVGMEWEEDKGVAIGREELGDEVCWFNEEGELEIEAVLLEEESWEKVEAEEEGRRWRFGFSEIGCKIDDDPHPLALEADPLDVTFGAFTPGPVPVVEVDAEVRRGLEKMSSDWVSWPEGVG